MHSVKTGSQAEVRAVIHDEPGTVPDGAAQLPAPAEHCARMPCLIAILDQRRPGLQKLPGKLDNRSRRIRRGRKMHCINDWVEARKLLRRHQDCKAISRARSSCNLDRRRSMYLVSVFPALKSSSSRMRRCRGMVV